MLHKSNDYITINAGFPRSIHQIYFMTNPFVNDNPHHEQMILCRMASYDLNHALRGIIIMHIDWLRL